MRYETSFAGSEDPLSEGGVWEQDGYPNNGRLKKISGVCCGIGIGVSPPPWDMVAYVRGFANDNALVQGTIFIDPSMGSCLHELEILLRATANGTYVRAYEVNLQFDQNRIGAISLARWNGDGTSDDLPGGGTIHEDSGAIATGDVFAAECVGDDIKVYFKGILQYTFTDSSGSKIATGDGCGLGTFRRTEAAGGCDDGFDNSTGYTHFVADDGLGGGLERRITYRGA